MTIRAIGAFDRLERAFERDAGKQALAEMFKTICQVTDVFHVTISTLDIR